MLYILDKHAMKLKESWEKLRKVKKSWEKLRKVATDWDDCVYVVSIPFGTLNTILKKVE